MSANAPASALTLKPRVVAADDSRRGTAFPMPRVHRPQNTFLSGLGMAGSVLAAVVLAFTVASGIIAYSLTSEDPVATSSSAALVLDLRAADVGDAPLVLHARSAPRRAGERAAASTQQARAAAADVRGAADGALSASSGTQSSGGGAPNGGSSQNDPTAQTSSGKLPVGKALGQTTQAVGATTDTVGRRLQGVTDNVTDGLAPATQQTGALLQVIAQHAGAVLDRLLHKHQ
jgi:hypothetical protein